MSAASQPGRNVASARMIVAVSAPTAYRPNTPAPPNMPAPTPAFLPFSRNSSFASSISWRTSVVVWSESCLSNSLVGRSRTSPPALWSAIYASEESRGRPRRYPGPGTPERRLSSWRRRAGGALAVGIHVAGALGVLLGRAALGARRVGPAVGLGLEPAGLGLELLGALEAPSGLGVTGPRLDAALPAALLPLAGHGHRRQGDERQHDDGQDHDQEGAHRGLLPVRGG